MEEQIKTWLKQLKLHESTVSMVMGALVVVVVGTLLYNYFTDISDQTNGEISDEAAVEEYTLELSEEEEGKLIPQNLPVSHTVNKGEHLWSIAEKYYGSGYNWVDIAENNNLSNPSLVTTGQKLEIPKVEVRVPLASKTTVQKAQTSNTITSNSYAVVKGDTLWDIAVRAYQDGYQWPKIYQANQDVIPNPNTIEVGMNLMIPR